MVDTILFVEDNPDDRELTIRALRRNNVTAEVVTLGDGVAAVEYLLGTGRPKADPLPELPRLVLLDLNLPRLGGIDVLRRLRANKRTQFLPVMVFTSSQDEQDMLDGYHFGVTRYARKPVSYTEFVEVVRELGVAKLLESASPPADPDRRARRRGNSHRGK